MAKVIDKAVLRERVNKYRESTKIAEVDPDKPSAIVRAPVEAGLDRFIEVRDLPDVDKLPFVAERMRDFAFRYASEMKSIRIWAKEYGVSPATIDKWLSHEGVRALIALTRYERRTYLQGVALQIEKKMYQVIDKILSVKITTDNMSALLSTAQFVWKMINAPNEVPSSTKRAFTASIGIDIGSNGRGEKNPYEKHREITAEDIQKLDAQIEYLEYIQRNTDDGGDDTIIQVEEE